MKQLMRILGLFKALLVIAVALAAAPSFAGDLVKEIKERGVFRVGMAESPPWQSPNPTTGKYEGFNVDLAEQVAKVLGVQLEIVPNTWATIIPGLEAGQYDAVFANLFATPERAIVVDFTEPYFTYGFHVIVNAKSGITTMDNLNSPEVTFVGESGTVEESYPKELYPQANVRGVVTNDIAAWIGEVASGQADAAFIDPGTLRLLQLRSPALASRLTVLNGEDTLVKPVGLAYAIRPGEQHFLNFLNTFIRDVVRNGENVKLRDKWFEELAKRS
ncbi:polar amino acid transport system substrate-binding protein [Mycoplana sp. BE70]|uniref:substrate-binding periplasmic protein n=1 Tax=Mycoplana sp. BE70 TaxID=2817775 RepID=UPI00285B792C|nr:transporter substrate-binding domain-containing protein [Mycoplana sp. BE70]MDR6755138.1 polar amino acid transport system substrate-binding protein [Mycoplana sp. BE70]